MCGVLGLKFRDKTAIADYAVSMLMFLQHRGQDAAGISLLKDDTTFESLKGLGLIGDALHGWQKLPDSTCALAHTRYATTGKGGVAEVQPFVKGKPRVAMAHNGNLVNVAELQDKFGLDEHALSDLQFLQALFLEKYNESADIVTGIQNIYHHAQGAYAVVGLTDKGELFGFRDPYGIRPLYMASGRNSWAMASESAALNPLRDVVKDIQISEVQAGEWVVITKEGDVKRGFLTSQLNPEHEKKSCMFESVYFASPQSEMDGDSVFRARFRLGEVLGQEIIARIGERPKDVFDYVVPVPETSRIAATAVAEQLKIPYREYLVKNPYIPRTFILSEQAQRLKALNAKLSLIGPEIKNQSILLVDDSVVRGNTSKIMALRLREAGAKKVYLASTCPPIRHGCFYGIDFPDSEELVANGHKEEDIADIIGADGLFYISLNGLKKALKSETHCLACLDGKYPVGEKYFDSFRTRRREERAEP